MIMNESLTFFLAGSLTQASVLSNTISYFIMNKKIMERARESVAANFPAFANKNASLEELSKELDLSVLDLEKDDYLKLCLYESLRIESPVAASTSICLTETQTIEGVTIKAGDVMFINIHQLHHNEDQWGKDHNIYRPERFGKD